MSERVGVYGTPTRDYDALAARLFGMEVAV